MRKQINVIALDEFGGLQALYCNLLSALWSRGVDVTTFNRARRRPASQILERNGFREHVESPAAIFPFDGMRGTFHARRLLGQLNLLRRVRGEVAHSNPCHIILWNAFPYVAYAAPGSGMILYDHGLSSIHRPNDAKRNGLNGVERIICVSHANERLLRDRWHFEGRIDILPNPLRPDIPIAALAAPRQLRDGAPVIGCAARLVPVKGIASLVHAMATLRDRGIASHLKVAGTGPELGALTGIVRRLDLGDRVAFVEHVEDMSAFYNAIDIYAAPSLREPFGLSALEAMAHGLPVVLSNVDGHPEAIPYRDAAIFMEPTLPVDSYYALGASSNNVPSAVYSPMSDMVVETKAMSPKVLADAIEHAIADYGIYAAAAFTAAGRIPSDFSFDRYVDDYIEIIS